MQTIYLDISNKGIIPCIQAKQSEVGRKFLAVITDNGVPYNIPNDSLLSVWYEGDTDAGNYSSIEEKSAFSIDGNKVTVELVAQMLLKPGNGELCLSITHGDGGETNTWNIPYLVEYKPGAGSSVPTEYYTALQEVSSNAAKSSAEAKKYAEQAQETVEGYVKADGTVPMKGSFDSNNYIIKNVGLPENDGDAANKLFAMLCFHPDGLSFNATSASSLDEITDNGAYRINADPPITTNDSRIDILLHFNVSKTAGGAAVQFGFSYDGIAQVRTHWYTQWHEWRIL